MQEIVLRAPESFSLESVLSSHGWSQLAPFEPNEAGTTVEYAFIDQRDTPVSVHISEGSGGDIVVQVHARQRLSSQNREFIASAVGRMLSFATDLKEFYELAARHPRLRHVPRNRSGRLLRSATLWEDIVKTILTTNVTWSGTRSMVSRLVENFGRDAPGSLKAFPTPQDILQSTPGDFASTARLGYRAAAVYDLAHRWNNGEFTNGVLDSPELETEELRHRLVGLRGVGPYASASLLMLIGRYEHVPVDSWALTLVSREWHGGAPITSADVRARFDEWGKWKALAYWFWDWSSVIDADN